jgi:hypothetical protein
MSAGDDLYCTSLTHRPDGEDVRVVGTLCRISPDGEIEDICKEFYRESDELTISLFDAVETDGDALLYLRVNTGNNDNAFYEIYEISVRQDGSGKKLVSFPGTNIIIVRTYDRSYLQTLEAPIPNGIPQKVGDTIYYLCDWSDIFEKRHSLLSYNLKDASTRMIVEGAVNFLDEYIYDLAASGDWIFYSLYVYEADGSSLIEKSYLLHQKTGETIRLPV